jgi:phage regulator Rha-like protein
MTTPRRDSAHGKVGEVGKAESNLSNDDSRPDAPLQSQIVEIVTDKNEPQIDSRTIADFLGVKHRSTFALIQDFKTDFEQLGKVRFKTEALPSGQNGKFAMLNEDQCYLLLTYSRNSKRVRALKVKLVQAFSEARRALETMRVEYMPQYHALHDQIHDLANGESSERFIHLNINRLINKFAGIEPGSRHRETTIPRSRLIFAQAVVSGVVAGSTSPGEAYARAKDALNGVAACERIGGGD